MKPELRFETKKMMSSDLGPQACVPDLIGEYILQNDTKFDLGEHDEIYEGFGRKRSAYPMRSFPISRPSIPTARRFPSARNIWARTGTGNRFPW